MRLISFMIAAAVAATPVFAQQAQRSSNPQGVKIEGNTNVIGVNQNTAAVAIGEGNTAKNTAGAIKGGTQIKGNTNVIGVNQNTAAVAIGKNNTAANEAGVIGGK
ncbi:hypothetical protein [Dechloromonas sp.]|uniref:hypothetical protein n=1 Tax=Dechloromonas sp. TaxID=1917218 RepID=UPI0011FC8183|nr:hypothetical protein [Dechloromonas sp.]MBU3695205.1 hypothetical protein [Dechloromonas sp.]TEX47706.1 MAG: hypothetical protein CFR70_09340 [Rhodocyclaceae bacterium]